MEIMLEVVSRQKFTPGFISSHVFSEVGGYIGRAETCEWCLIDKSKLISRRHALVSCDGKHFYIEDTSSNGILSPLTRRPFAKGMRHPIEHGESFILGEYTIQARLLHKPDQYLQPGMSMTDSIIPDHAVLDADPLVAMDQQDDFIAKQRLGLYNDLIGDMEVSTPQLADHTEPRLDILPSITAIPENWATPDAAAQRQVAPQQPAPLPAPPLYAQGPQDNESLIPGIAPLPVNEAATAAPINMFHPLVEKHPHVVGAPLPKVVPDDTRIPTTPQPETNIFFEALGFTSPPETQEERERVLRLAAELLHSFTDGMIEALHNRAESKNELRLPITTIRMASDNPLKYSHNASAALAHFFGPGDKGTLSPQQAVRTCFKDLHAHHLGLLAGARAAVHASLRSVSPTSVEAKLDSDGPVRMKRTTRLWNTYIRMHQSMLDSEEGFAAFFLNDFSRAYTMQQHTLHPYANKNIKGDA